MELKNSESPCQHSNRINCLTHATKHQPQQTNVLPCRPSKGKKKKEKKKTHMLHTTSQSSVQLEALKSGYFKKKKKKKKNRFLYLQRKKTHPKKLK